MSNIKFLFLFIIFAIQVGAQRASDHYFNGMMNQKAGDYNGAIADYDKALGMNSNMVEAYNNRGVCRQNLGDYEWAINDFNTAIRLKPANPDPYWNRAISFIKTFYFGEALKDLNKVIELDSTRGRAYLFRGQVEAAMFNIDEACKDFTKASSKKIGEAVEYTNAICVEEGKPGESLYLCWPIIGMWNSKKYSDNGNISTLEYFRKNEDISNWKFLAQVSRIKSMVDSPLDKCMEEIFVQVTKDNAPKAKLKQIEMQPDAAVPYAVFKIEAKYFEGYKGPCSQLWYIVRGKEGLHTVMIAFPLKTFPVGGESYYSRFFKSAKLINR